MVANDDIDFKMPEAPAPRVLVALEGAAQESVRRGIADVERQFRERPGSGVPVVRVVQRRPEGVGLASPEEAFASPKADGGAPGEVVAGGVGGTASAVHAVLREADAMGVQAAALVAVDRGDGGDWSLQLIGPVATGGFDYACPTYARSKFDGTLIKGVVYPLTRTLFGLRLRQPLGGEMAVSRGFARRLLDTEEWESDPNHAGSDAWLVAKAATLEARVCEVRLGVRPKASADPKEDASHLLARVLSLVFREVERNADWWQRGGRSQPVLAMGEAEVPDASGGVASAEPLLGLLELGARELQPVWSLVLPPATLFALHRALRATPHAFQVDDALWARIVYDFAVGYFTKVMDRAQLLHSMTPLYLGWVASYHNAVRDLDGAAAELRVDELCQAFEREKPYLIARWRWPDRFSP